MCTLVEYTKLGLEFILSSASPDLQWIKVKIQTKAANKRCLLSNFQKGHQPVFDKARARVAALVDFERILPEGITNEVWRK